ncbi:MAG: hypothetical protein WC389_22690 [Lutibacter sp.]|jgi:hypothetical protein
MYEYKRGDKVRVISNKKSQLPFDAIGWIGLVHNNMTEMDDRKWILFPTGFLGRDEIWYVHPEDMELIK